MNVSVDKELCIGCGVCESNCPEVFEMQDNIAIVKVGVIPADQEDAVEKMVNDCPVSAIKIED